MKTHAGDNLNHLLNMPQNKQNILVIKLSALGDFIQALGPMKAIRAHHPDAKVTLLTTKPFEKFAKGCGYFDEIWLDERPKWHQPLKWIALRNLLNDGRFSRVYDLQNNDRSSGYFKLLSTPKPEWVGVAKGASHRNTAPSRTAGHAYDGHVETLGKAGISRIEIDDLSWIEADISGFKLRKPYVLLVSGCAPQHPQKRWPAKNYGALATKLNEQGYQPVLLGTAAEKEVTDIIAEHCPSALNLTGQTSLDQLIVLGRGASGAIGNDTGPMHMIAPTGCPSLVLFSAHSNPIKHAPKGAHVSVLQKNNLDDLGCETVLEKFNPRKI